MDQNYANLKVPGLKDLLIQRGLKVTGTKAELIQRLIDNDALAPAAATPGRPATNVMGAWFGGRDPKQEMKDHPELIFDQHLRDGFETELRFQTVEGLKQYARDLGIAVLPKLRKGELIQFIIRQIETMATPVQGGVGGVRIEQVAAAVPAAATAAAAAGLPLPDPEAVRARVEARLRAAAIPGIPGPEAQPLAMRNLKQEMRTNPELIRDPTLRAAFERDLRTTIVIGLKQYAHNLGIVAPPKLRKEELVQYIIRAVEEMAADQRPRPGVPSPPARLGYVAITAQPEYEPTTRVPQQGGVGGIRIGQMGPAIGPAVYRPPVAYQPPGRAASPKKAEKKGITHPVSPLTIKGISDTIKNIPLDDDAPLKTLTKKYGFNRRSNNEISRLISDHQYGEGTNPITFQNRLYSVDILTEEPNRIVPVGAALNYKLANQSFDDALQLLWWENIFDAPDRLHPAEKRYVSELNRDQLLQILAPTGYNGPSDPASLIWAIVKRQMPTRPDITKEPRYPEILDLNKILVLRDAVLLHNYYNPELEVPSFFTPPRHLAIGQESPLDPFILTYNGDVDGFAQALQMIFPNSVKTKEEKEEYFFKNLKYYGDIFTRPDEIIPPPDITGMTKDRVKNILRQYTDEELADAYEITSYNWTSRKDFISKLADEARGGARWFYRKKRCSNEDTINIATGDRGRDKNDPTDPVISYGTMKDYRCYNISELELSFRETEVGFQFAVPDWETGQVMQTFPIESIRQLRQMLVDANDTALYGELIKKIDEGFAQMNNAGRRLRSLKAQYDAFPADRKEMVRDYLAWMFLYAMWMRFWQGPGRVYPVIWKEGGGTTGAGGEYCELATREANVMYMQNVRAEILESMPRDLVAWILQLPRVRYNFQTGEPTLGQETIDFLIQKVIEGNFCLADASDKTGQTAYYLITRLFSMNDAEFNAFIKEKIPRIYQKYELKLEKDALESIVRALEKKDVEKDKKMMKQQANLLKKVAAQLYETPPVIVTDPINKVKLLQQAKGFLTQLPQLQAQKLLRVQDQAQKQPDFNPGRMTLTYHTDPYITIRDVNQ